MPIIGKIIPSELHIVLCAVIASIVLAIVAPIKPEDSDDADAKEGEE